MSTSAYTAGLIDLDFTGGGPIGTIRVGYTVMDDDEGSADQESGNTLKMTHTFHC